MDCPQAYIIVILVNQVPAQTTITLGGILFGRFTPPPSLGSMQHEDISLWFVPCSKKIISMHAQSLSCVPLFATSWTVAHQAPLSMGFPRQEYWSGLLFPTPRDLPNPGIELKSPVWTGRFSTTEPSRKPFDSMDSIKQTLAMCLLLNTLFLNTLSNSYSSP